MAEERKPDVAEEQVEAESAPVETIEQDEKQDKKEKNMYF